MKAWQCGRLDSPLGEILIVFDGQHLCALDFSDYEGRMLKLLNRYYGDVSLEATSDPGGLCGLMQRYFEGDVGRLIGCCSAFSRYAGFNRPCGGSSGRISAGSTWSYGELAKSIGKPTGSRAVGMANGSNPIAIVVPCHRVIGANGSLTGYGGGIERKRWLLQHEGVYRQLSH